MFWSGTTACWVGNTAYVKIVQNITGNRGTGREAPASAEMGARWAGPQREEAGSARRGSERAVRSSETPAAGTPMHRFKRRNASGLRKEFSNGSCPDLVRDMRFWLFSVSDYQSYLASLPVFVFSDFFEKTLKFENCSNSKKKFKFRYGLIWKWVY
jgi:hypothetical protein